MALPEYFITYVYFHVDQPVTIFQMLNNDRVRTIKDQMEVDFTDRHYQMQLPMHARSTASHSIKNNLKITEFMTEPNIITNKQKVLKNKYITLYEND